MDKPEVHPDAKALAEEVDRLYVQGANGRVFAEQIEAFKREDAARLVAENKARESARAADQAILAEHEAVQAGKAKARLTDADAPPAEGWRWRIVHQQGHHIQGWVPPDVARDWARDRADWPANPWPANPSRATMFALLSAFHDACLPLCRPILNPITADPAAAYVTGDVSDVGNLSIIGARLWVVPAVRGDAKRLPTLRRYADHVAKHLEEESAKAVRAAESRAQALERKASVLSGFLGFVLAAIVIGALEVYIHLASGQFSQWILGHNRSLGLQLSFGLVIFLGFMGLFLRNYWKWIWGTGVLAIVAVILQII
jgi:hypothetical protein